MEGRIELYWLPLGAGGQCVRRNGRVFEALVAAREHRARADLYHSALEVRLADGRHVIEMTPVWNGGRRDRGVVSEGPVGSPLLGRSRLFRYEVRRWRGGAIPDVAEAVDSPVLVSDDPHRAGRLLELVPAFPTATWGRDELRAGEMWNSNSLIAWLLARSGPGAELLTPPRGGRAPGWGAGQVVAAREAPPPG